MENSVILRELYTENTEAWSVVEIVKEMRGRAYVSKYISENNLSFEVWDIDENSWKAYFADLMHEFEIV